MAKSNFSPFKSLFLYPFPASMSSGSDKVDTVADGFSGAHAKLFPGAKHNGSGNMARDQKNPIVLNKFSLSLGSKQKFPRIFKAFFSMMDEPTHVQIVIFTHSFLISLIVRNTKL